MEISDITITHDPLKGVSAELVGGYCTGDAGYVITVMGWGHTEADARASLHEALVALGEEKAFRAG